MMNKSELQIFQSQLEEQLLKNKDICSDLNTDFMNCAWQNLYRATQINFSILRKIEKVATQKENFISLFFTNALSDILNALQSTMGGFSRGPGIILRGVIENLGCAVSVLVDQKRYEKYISNKLKLSAQISFAKKYFPELAEYYGLLTETFAHEKFETSARCLLFDGDDAIHTLLPTIKKDDFSSFLLFCISYIARLTGAISEYCFASRIESFYYYSKCGDQIKEKKDTYEDDLIRLCIKIAQSRQNGWVIKN